MAYCNYRYLPTILVVLGFTFCVVAPPCAVAFIPRQHVPSTRNLAHGSGTTTTSTTAVFLSSSNNNQFDVSKPVFDPLSLRSVRGDALVRYDATNQSEPLRITLYALLSLTSAVAPSLVEATGFDLLGLPQTLGCGAAAAGSGLLFLRECGRRSRQLTRIEKELNTESLPIRPPNTRNPFSEQPFGRPVTLRQIRGSAVAPRILALCGNREQLAEALSALVVYRNRLAQASVYVVAVSTDGSKPAERKVLDDGYYKSWLADSYQPGVWLDYFRSLTTGGGGGGSNESADDDSGFRWFGLNSNGRSFGSGDGAIQVIQLMGQ